MPNIFAAPLLIATVLASLASPASASGEQASDSPSERLAATLRSTLRYAAGLEAELRRVESAHADALSETGAGIPYLEYQREGIGSSFDRQPNSQDSLRLGMPFKMPWHSTDTRALEKAAENRKAFTSRALELEAMARSGALWLEVAALDERILVVRNRLELFDRLLRIQKKRLELGEVAGTEVMQLELARAGEVAREAGLVASRQSCREQLALHCGAACELALPGDLETLLASPLPIRNTAGEHPIDSLPRARAAASKRDLAETLAAITSRSVWGYPEIQLEWEHIPSFEGLEGWDALGLQLTIPLPFGRTGGRQLERAQAEAHAAAADLRAEERALDQRRSASGHRASAAETKLAVLEPLLLKRDRSEYSLAEQYRLGAISYLVFLDGVGRLDGISIEAIDAREELLLSHLELASLLDDPTLMPQSASTYDVTRSETSP